MKKLYLSLVLTININAISPDINKNYSNSLNLFIPPSEEPLCLKELPIIKICKGFMKIHTHPEYRRAALNTLDLFIETFFSELDLTEKEQDNLKGLCEGLHFFFSNFSEIYDTIKIFEMEIRDFDSADERKSLTSTKYPLLVDCNRIEEEIRQNVISLCRYHEFEYQFESMRKRGRFDLLVEEFREVFNNEILLYFLKKMSSHLVR